MASLSGTVSGANAAFHGALDELSSLKNSIIGGILSIPIVSTALVTAANIIIVVNILKIIKKLPTKISGLQTELLTIAGFAVGSAAYTKALEGLEKSELGKTMISAGHDIANLAAATRGIVNTTTNAAARARGIARNVPNYFFDELTGEARQIAQGTLLSGEDAESEPKPKPIPLNTEMMESKRARFEQWYAAGRGATDDTDDETIVIRIEYPPSS